MRTHLAIGALIALFFLPYVTNKLIFVPIVLVVSLLPDIDSAYSYFGHKIIFRPLQFFFKHRGLIHSFTLCVFITLGFAFFAPVLALPFFLGYAGHLFADSLSIEGIRPFWPFKIESAGKIKVGGRVEDSLFLVICILDLLLLVYTVI